jgi:hypothetical protein
MAYVQEMQLPYRNLNPCLVDHVDYLLGGSIANHDRFEKKVRAKFWEDEDLVKDLEVRLADRK